MTDWRNRMVKPISYRNLQPEMKTGTSSLRLLSKNITTTPDPLFSEELTKLKEKIAQWSSLALQSVEDTERAIKVNLKHGWAYHSFFPDYLYIEASEQKTSEAVNDCFIYYLEQENIFQAFEEELIEVLGESWRALVEQISQMVTDNYHEAVIPNILILLEKVMLEIDNQKFWSLSPGKLRNEFKNTVKNEDLLSYYTYYNFDKMFQPLVKKKLYEPIWSPEKKVDFLNRNLVIHGKSDPHDWTLIRMYQIIFILFSFVDIYREYHQLELV